MYKKLSTLVFCMLFSLAAIAQITIKGKVTSAEDGLGLPGVNVLEKGTTNGVATNIEGDYTLTVASNSSIIIFSSIGMQTIEISASKAGDIVMQIDNNILEEVVVTALGIKREKKSLGYAIQEVSGDELLESRETNLANSFTGKVAGLQIVRGSNGPASSSKIVLRGNSSLTGDNQPLIVVDGVPMDNFTGAKNNDFWNPGADMGNGLGDLNPNDVESMSVLKGPAAAALYGSRAGNGVILITTKSGKARPGLGITYSTSLGIETIFMKPDLQTSFGQGSNGVYDKLSGSSWGPKITGQEIEKWNNSKTKMNSFDNVDNFMDTGISLNNTLSFQQQISNGTSLYSSITYVDNKSNIPGAKLERFNFTTRALSKFGQEDKWTTDFKVQYTNSKVKNRPINGNNPSSSFGVLLSLPTSLDIRDFEKAIDDTGNHIWYNASSGLNPYWGYRYNLNQDYRDRFMLNGSLKYQVTDWLNAEIKAGADIYTTNTENKLYAKGPLSSTGKYGKGMDNFREINTSFLLSATKDELLGKFGGAATFGGNLMYRKATGISANVKDLEVPNLFSLNNGKDKPVVNEYFSEHKINSLYGTFQINYDRFLFLDLTWRNDWSSVLSEANRSFFYPSVGTSFVFSDFLDKNDNKPKWFTYGKIRTSYAEVGNDMGPYQLYNFYYVSKDPNGNTVAGRNNVLYSENVKNELIKSWEAGLEVKLFDNKLGFDLSLYKSNATNQLLNIPMNPLSGYQYKKINAGDIQNKGFELMINARPIETNDFAWDMTLNISKNENKVIELFKDPETGDEVNQYALGGFDNISILAAAGQKYGTIYGSKYKRVEDENSEYFGKIIVDANGIPEAAEGKHYLGNQQPDAMIGLTNAFGYKNLSFSFLIDARLGGKIYSGTNYGLKANGNSKVTVVDGERKNFIFDGVVENGKGGFTKNTKEVSPQDFWTSLSGKSSSNLGITEDNLFSATNIRIRNIQINYQLPSKWIEPLKIQNAKVGFSVNNVLMLKSHLNGIDPESVYATGSNAVGFEYFSSPTSRSYFFNLSISF